MKFASLIAVASAVRVTQKGTKGGDGPSPADIIDECDTSGNGMLSKDEVHACIAEHVPAEHQEEANEMVDKMWDHVDKNGDGEIDEHELSKAMRGGPPKKLAKLMKKGKGGSDSEGSDSESDGEKGGKKKKKGGKGKKGKGGSDSEGSGSESEGEKALVQKKGGKGKKGSDDEGSGSDSESDGEKGGKGKKGKGKKGDGSDSESDGEALVQKKGGKKGKGKKGKGDSSDSESSGSDSESDGEEEALVQKYLAQKGGKGPSAKDIIDACDGNGSGGIDLEEAHACIDAHISDPEKNAQAHEMVDEGFEHVDKNGDGEIDKKELKAAMKAHK